ncbi:MAG: hypothetical protein K9W44_13910 [Candidatus Lokiarchaeota archaeon]|nr:hypothetical protein [Candidatus Harpocratesius repetitus]
MLRQKTLFKFVFFGGLLLLFLTPFIATGSTLYEQQPSAQNIINAPSSATGVDSNIYIRNFTRIISINESGFITYEDSYIFVNDGPNTHFSLPIGLTEQEAEEIIYYQAYDQNMGPLTAQLSNLKLNQTNILEVLLTEPLKPYSEIVINIKISIKGFINYQSTFGRFVVYLQLAPRSPFYIDTYETEAHVPYTAQNVQVSDNSNYVGPLDGDLANVHKFYPGSANPFSDIYNTIIFTDTDAKIIQINQIDRTITVNPWGYIRVVENHQIQSFTNGYVTEVKFSLPEGYSNLKVYDDLGDIKDIKPASTTNSKRMVDITVQFIINRAPLQYAQKMDYTVSYYLDFDKYFSNHFGEKNFAIDLYPLKTNYLTIKVNTRVELENARQIERISLDAEQIVETAEGIIIETTDTYITPYHNFHFDVTYKINSFLMIDRAIIFSLLFIAIGALYVVNASRKERTEDIVISATSIPIKELQEFVTLYEEKNAITIELDSLEKNYLKRKVQKKAYVREEKTLSTKLKKLEEELLPFKKELLESATAVANVIQKLDYLEAEKISLKDSIRNLNNRYRKGKLPSKAAYDKLSRDFEKKLESAQRKIDRNINELRSYLI